MNNTVKYRQDYKPSSFLIDTVHLTVDLSEEKARVTAILAIYGNKENPATELILDGCQQKLLSVKINNQVVDPSQYNVTDEQLIIKNVPHEFQLEIISENEPQNNTELMGLYKSGGNFCTQCEAEGFRKITYYLDRPDVMAIFTTKIIADKKQYPVLLANGNLIEQGDLENGRHFAVWNDPFRKPCYLFAMVAGNLAKIEDHFITMHKRKVTLQIFAAQSVIHQCDFAMEALKKAMRWDEEVYGREYDLDIFMIVAVNDFNFGAMENKGLNIFNDKFILADAKTATDFDYASIDLVVGHEYFHNWSGNRVTLRDWFQLSLKEGFTVFREQSFTESVALAEVDRIHNVKRLRSAQFPEDAGPLAHPVRPDSYIEMNNFYTMTVYEKGSEVIRMLRTILGVKKYRQATDLYFAKNDGKAVTCDDFVQAMEEASGLDLTQFKLWYSQSGTPELKVKSEYITDKKQFHLYVEQSCPPTPNQPVKQAMHIPLVIGLLNKTGKDMHLPEATLNIKKQAEHFIFENIAEKPVLSLSRGFSAPVKMTYDYSEEELAFLMAHDSDGVARWEAGQQYAVQVLLKLIKQYQQKENFSEPHLFLQAMLALLNDKSINKALIAEMLLLPDELYLCELMEKIDVEAIVAARQFLKKTMAQFLHEALLKTYQENLPKAEYRYVIEDVASRALRNACLHYLVLLETKEILDVCFEQFSTANNMTDQFAALSALVNTDSVYRSKALAAFYGQWQHAHLVVDKWFAVQAAANSTHVIDDVKELLKHSAFNLKNPNRARSVLTFFSKNFAHFHAASGEGYALLAEYVLLLDKINPSVAARLVAAFANWREFTEPRCKMMKDQLEMIAAKELSPNVYEIVTKSLAD